MCVAVVLLTLAPAAASAETITLVPIQDNTLFQDLTGALSNGAGQHLFAGRSTQPNEFSRRRGLVKFNLSGQIPSGATVTGATLKLHMSRTVAGATFVSVHRALAGWGEGLSDALGREGAGIAAQTDDATWLHRRFDTELWTVPGGDFVPTASATTTVIGIGLYTWGPTPEMLADVQAWRQDPGTNHGWLIRGEESFSPTAKRFDTRENPDPSFRPVLEIEYFIPVPAASTWGLVVTALVLLGVGTILVRAQQRPRVATET